MDKIIVFDLDGVLVDSKLAHAEAFNLAFEANALPRLKPERIFREFGPPRDVLVREIFPNIQYRKLMLVCRDKDKFLIEQTYKLAKPIYGAQEALEELKKKYKIAVVSNSDHEEILLLLEQANINPKVFDLILGANDIEKHKPDIDPLRKVERLLDGAVEYLVGDQVIDIQMGRAFKVETVAVLSGIDDMETLSKARPTVIIRNVTLLPEVINEQL